MILAPEMGRVEIWCQKRVFDCALANFVCGQFGNEGYRDTVVSKRYCNVCLRTTKGSLVGIALYKTQVVEWRKAQHKFTKCNNFHVSFSPIV